MKIFYSFLATVLFSSCSFMLGIHQPRKLSEIEIIKAKQKIGINDSATLFIDKDYLQAITSCLPSEQKHHLQPLQILFYNKEGRLISFFINCNMRMKGLRLDWNTNEMLDSFYYKTASPIDSCLNLLNLQQRIKSTNSAKIWLNSNSDLIAILFWNKFMFKQSKNMIKQYKYALKKNNSFKIKTIYVNDDNLFSELN